MMSDSLSRANTSIAAIGNPVQKEGWVHNFENVYQDDNEAFLFNTFTKIGKNEKLEPRELQNALIWLLTSNVIKDKNFDITKELLGLVCSYSAVADEIGEDFFVEILHKIDLTPAASVAYKGRATTHVIIGQLKRMYRPQTPIAVCTVIVKEIIQRMQYLLSEITGKDLVLFGRALTKPMLVNEPLTERQINYMRMYFQQIALYANLMATSLSKGNYLDTIKYMRRVSPPITTMCYYPKTKQLWGPVEWVKYRLSACPHFMFGFNKQLKENEESRRAIIEFLKYCEQCWEYNTDNNCNKNNQESEIRYPGLPPKVDAVCLTTQRVIQYLSNLDIIRMIPNVEVVQKFFVINPKVEDLNPLQAMAARNSITLKNNEWNRDDDSGVSHQSVTSVHNMHFVSINGKLTSFVPVDDVKVDADNRRSELGFENLQQYDMLIPQGIEITDRAVTPDRDRVVTNRNVPLNTYFRNQFSTEYKMCWADTKPYIMQATKHNALFFFEDEVPDFTHNRVRYKSFGKDTSVIHKSFPFYYRPNKLADLKYLVPSGTTMTQAEQDDLESKLTSENGCVILILRSYVAFSEFMDVNLMSTNIANLFRNAHLIKVPPTLQANIDAFMEIVLLKALTRDPNSRNDNIVKDLKKGTAVTGTLNTARKVFDNEPERYKKITLDALIQAFEEYIVGLYKTSGDEYSVILTESGMIPSVNINSHNLIVNIFNNVCRILNIKIDGMTEEGKSGIVLELATYFGMAFMITFQELRENNMMDFMHSGVGMLWVKSDFVEGNAMLMMRPSSIMTINGTPTVKIEGMDDSSKKEIEVVHREISLKGQLSFMYPGIYVPHIFHGMKHTHTTNATAESDNKEMCVKYLMRQQNLESLTPGPYPKDDIIMGAPAKLDVWFGLLCSPRLAPSFFEGPTTPVGRFNNYFINEEEYARKFAKRDVADIIYPDAFVRNLVFENVHVNMNTYCLYSTEMWNSEFFVFRKYVAYNPVAANSLAATIHNETPRQYSVNADTLEKLNEFVPNVLGEENNKISHSLGVAIPVPCYSNPKMITPEKAREGESAKLATVHTTADDWYINYEGIEGKYVQSQLAAMVFPTI